MVKLRNENSFSYSLPYLHLITELQLKGAEFRWNLFAFFPNIVRFVRSFKKTAPIALFLLN